VSSDQLLSLAIILLIVTGSVIAVNAIERYSVTSQQKTADLRRYVLRAMFAFDIVTIVLGIAFLVGAYLVPTALDETDEAEVWISSLTALVVGGAGIALLSPNVRRRLIPLFPRAQASEEGVPMPATPDWTLQPKPEAIPLFPQILNYYTQDTLAQESAIPTLLPPSVENNSQLPVRKSGFRPDSLVHLTAMYICLYMLGMQIISFVQGGGLAGLAETYGDRLSITELLANFVPFVVLSLFGVGLGTRRNWAQVRERLGLYWPGTRGALIALTVVLILFAYVIALSAIWIALVSQETYEEQTKASDALAESVNSIGLAFLLAATAAIGEEMAFRGALQPVFGLWPTAIVFTLSHAQYTLTPAWLIILGVAVTFGWLRERYGTGAAIIAHFFYNFVPLALSLALPEEMLMAILRLLG
jgi:membrane protease YdiL (CAAX protease family)